MLGSFRKRDVFSLFTCFIDFSFILCIGVFVSFVNRMTFPKYLYLKDFISEEHEEVHMKVNLIIMMAKMRMIRCWGWCMVVVVPVVTDDNDQ